MCVYGFVFYLGSYTTRTIPYDERIFVEAIKNECEKERTKEWRFSCEKFTTDKVFTFMLLYSLCLALIHKAHIYVLFLFLFCRWICWVNWLNWFSNNDRGKIQYIKLKALVKSLKFINITFGGNVEYSVVNVEKNKNLCINIWLQHFVNIINNTE